MLENLLTFSPSFRHYKQGHFEHDFPIDKRRQLINLWALPSLQSRPLIKFMEKEIPYYRCLTLDKTKRKLFLFLAD